MRLIEEGEIDADSYENYLKIEKEKSHFESDALEKRQKEKDFGKMIKSVMADKRNEKGGKY